MLSAQIFTAILSVISPTYAVPLLHAALPLEPYNCGYVRTRWNSSVIVGISALSTCTPFFFNQTINDFQDAFAYRLYGGCKCQFYRNTEECLHEADVPVFTEPTDPWHESYFSAPKPKWYHCETHAE